MDFTPGAHALAPLRPLLPAGLARSAYLAALPAGTVVEVAGQAIPWQRPPTARGMLFLSLSDEDGLVVEQGGLCRFVVEDMAAEPGIFRMPHRWQHVQPGSHQAVKNGAGALALAAEEQKT